MQFEYLSSCYQMLPSSTEVSLPPLQDDSSSATLLPEARYMESCCIPDAEHHIYFPSPFLLFTLSPLSPSAALTYDQNCKIMDEQRK